MVDNSGGSKKERVREYRAELKSRGVCASCCSRKSEDGKSLCQRCLNKQKEKYKERKRNYEANGTCVACGTAEAKFNRRMCEGCLERSRVHSANKRKELKKIGICTNCQKTEARPGKATCQACQDRSVENDRKRPDNGICKRRDCFNKHVKHSRFCAFHHIEKHSRIKNKDPQFLCKLLDKLEDQNSQCVYTGDHLEIGNNASIDHRLPSSRGGDDSLDNLQWTTTLVNRMKTDMTHQEFLAQCRKIVDKADENSSPRSLTPAG